MNSLELKIPPVVLVLIIAIDMWLLSWIFASGLELGWQFTIPSLWLWISVAVGILLPVLGVLEFRKHKTTVNPMRPNESAAIIATGIYRYTRNLMYLGFFFLLLGFALWLGNLVALVMLPVFVWYLTRFQIIPEERMLREKFGEPYRNYVTRVRRWL